METWLVTAASIGLFLGLIAGVSYTLTGTNWLTWSQGQADSGQVA